MSKKIIRGFRTNMTLYSLCLIAFVAVTVPFQPLLAAAPDNPWYLDLATDIDLGQKKATDAINRLKGAKDLRNNPVLQLNLANAYLQGGQPGDCLLYTSQSPRDTR